MECSEFSSGIAVISCADTPNAEIIRNILGTKELPEAVKLTDKIKSYPWHIETKYYTANVNIIPLEEKDLVSQQFADGIEAVTIHFSSKEAQSFQEVQSWYPFIEKFSPHVQLLTCNNFSEEDNTGLTKHEILEWCLKKQFEFIELYPSEESDEEDDFRETRGYKRVVQALHAHTWSNLVMKEPPKYKPSEQVLSSFQEEGKRHGIAENSECALEDLTGNSATSSTFENGQLDANKAKAEKIDALFEEERWLFDAVGKEDPGGEAFELMFAKILNMKEKASTLTGDEKKMYAEKVAIEFWKALGGDEDEIAGLSSDEN